jgi:hypothetical protein
VDLTTQRHTVCGHRHRSYHAVAKCRWPKHGIQGDGPYAVVSNCARAHRPLIWLADTEAVAQTILDAMNNNNGCGERCQHQHEIYVIGMIEPAPYPFDREHFPGTLADSLARPRKRTDWGPWALDTETMVLRIEADGHPLVDYEVDLEWCLDSAQVLDWICQIAHKDHDDYPAITGLVNALDDVLDPQRNLCSSGKHKVITEARVHELARQAAAERQAAVPR